MSVRVTILGTLSSWYGYSYKVFWKFSYLFFRLNLVPTSDGNKEGDRLSFRFRLRFCHYCLHFEICDVSSTEEEATEEKGTMRSFRLRFRRVFRLRFHGSH